MKHDYPLIVDLDGTLIHSDILYETFLVAIKNNFFIFFISFYWILRGKAFLKSKLARYACNFDVTTLPYNKNFVDWLKSEKRKNRLIILCTATHNIIANKIGAHLGLFNEIISTNDNLNLSGKNKADILSRRFGFKKFDYVGNSFADIQVWKIARYAYGVNVSNLLVKYFQNHFKFKFLFSRASNIAVDCFSALRPHQWVKNLILFIPLLASHQFLNFNLWYDLLLSFISFSFCASAVYILNDLIDIENDRQHPRKMYRPFASGQLSIMYGFFISLIFLVLSFNISFLVNSQFKYWLFLYFVLTSSYSLFFRKVVLLDCVVLSLLYTIRIIAGGEAAHLVNSFWLLTFSVFLFLSLAFIKRYAEIEIRIFEGQKVLKGRGYYTSDAGLLHALGIASGYSATLILALYLNSDVVSSLYFSPYFIWADIPVLLFWISWMWLKAHRGEMHDDPVIFAIKDKISILAGLFFALFLFLGTLNFS